MNVPKALTRARRRAGLSQRRLAELTGVAQPTIARIESGAAIARVDTLERLLRACNEELEVLPRLGVGVDRSVIRELLAMTPAERAKSLIEEAEVLDRLDEAAVDV